MPGQELRQPLLRPCPAGIRPAQGRLRVEVQVAVQPPGVAADLAGGIDDLAENEAVRPGRLAGAGEIRPEVRPRPQGVIQPVAVHAEFLQPVDGVADHPLPRLRMPQVELRHLLDAEERAVADL